MTLAGALATLEMNLDGPAILLTRSLVAGHDGARPMPVGGT